ncbi:unnamed protein product [Phytophthora lilii]|uniref:Unnamed protein product n=1 Tax=Phytophthora lilii TaxID=2077276 RepID=A0A9W6YIZ3_9STRA|nr:unnamed protein product [Phytophthora lilii]
MVFLVLMGLRLSYGITSRYKVQTKGSDCRKKPSLSSSPTLKTKQRSTTTMTNVEYLMMVSRLKHLIFKQEQKKRFNGFKIASHNPNSWQIDLAFWEKRPILTAININSGLGRITQKLITDVIEKYNTTFHSSIGMTPNEAKGKVMDADLSHNQVEAERIEKEFDVGSSVLYRLKKKAFDKKAARWSKAVYKIVGIDGYRVQIRSRNGHTLYKAPHDLKMVKTETTDAVLIVAIFLKLIRSLIIRRHGLGSTNI